MTEIKDDDARTIIWKRAVEVADGQPTAKQVSTMVAEYMSENEASSSVPADSDAEDEGMVIGKLVEPTEVCGEEAEGVAVTEGMTEEVVGVIAAQAESPVTTLHDGENYDAEVSAPPNGMFLKKWSLMVSQIRGEALAKRRKEVILKLAIELASDIESV